MPLGDAYVTLGELKDHCQIPDTVDDTALTRVSKAISRGLERYTGRQFNDAGTPSARVFTADAGRAMYVDDFSTVTGLLVDVDNDGDGVFEQSVPAADFLTHPLGGVVNGVPGFPFFRLTLRRPALTWLPCDEGAVQVTARWGWTTVPDDVKSAALIKAARLFGRRYSVNGLIGQGEFVFRVTRNADPDVVELLAPYRRMVIG